MYTWFLFNKLDRFKIAVQRLPSLVCVLVSIFWFSFGGTLSELIHLTEIFVVGHCSEMLHEQWQDNVLVIVAQGCKTKGFHQPCFKDFVQHYFIV